VIALSIMRSLSQVKVIFGRCEERFGTEHMRSYVLKRSVAIERYELIFAELR
jgi:hypothetical protein